MADKRTTPETPQNQDAAAGARRKKRMPPTIDLTATEVLAAAPEPAAAAQPQPAAQAASAPPRPEPPPAGGAASGSASSGSTSYVVPLAAGFAGAAVMAGILVALWLANLLPIPGPGDQRAQIGALAARVQALQDRLAAIDGKSIDALGQRVSKIEETIGKLPTGDAGVADRLSAAENAMKSLGVALAALNRRSDDVAANAAQARARADEAAQAVNDLRASLDNVAKPSGGIPTADFEALQQRVAALELAAKAVREEIAKASSADTAARRSLSAAALRDAALSGAPFAAELAQAKSLGADDKTLAALAPFAASGVPTAAALAQELHALLPAMVKLAGAQAPQGGFLERLQANAGKLVRIRPVDAPPGDDAAAVLARLEIDAAKADLSAALGDLGKLPAAARELAQGWITKANAREAALKAARQYAADTARALGSR